jgi:hypothetical protein
VCAIVVRQCQICDWQFCQCTAGDTGPDLNGTNTLLVLDKALLCDRHPSAGR